MGESTKIEWCDYTFNPWIGCTEVSPGCANCYAKADMDKRRGRAKWGPHGTRSKTATAYWQQPHTWNRKASTCPFCGARYPRVQMVNGKYVCTACRIQGTPTRRPRVFCGSLCDVFEDWGDVIVDHNGCELANATLATAGPNSPPLTMDDLRRDLFAMSDATPFLDWLLVTKRPENIHRMWPVSNGGQAEGRRGDGLDDLLPLRKNVWLLTSCEDQAAVDRRIPDLLKCRELAAVLGVSAEPLLGPIEFSNVRHRADCVEQLGKRAMEGIDWVIVGGESGNGARPCNIEDVRSIRDQCQAAGVACFVKQLGAWPHYRGSGLKPGPNYQPPRGRDPREPVEIPLMLSHPKGGDPDEWPEDLRVREFPVVRQRG